jgi:hypothetical protein
MCVLCKSKIGSKICEIFQLLHLFLTCFCWEYLAEFVTFESFACLLPCYFCSYCYILFCPRTDSRGALISSCYLQACANCRSFSSRKGYLQQQQPLNLTPGILFHLRSVPWIHLGLQILVRVHWSSILVNEAQFLKLSSSVCRLKMHILFIIEEASIIHQNSRTCKWHSEFWLSSALLKPSWPRTMEN